MFSRFEKTEPSKLKFVELGQLILRLMYAMIEVDNLDYTTTMSKTGVHHSASCYYKNLQDHSFIKGKDLANSLEVQIQDQMANWFGPWRG